MLSSNIMIASDNSLKDELAASLPDGHTFIYYHISTPPTRCLAIYAPPTGGEHEKTYSESHSLTISIPVDKAEVAVFAIELILFTTARLTTVFISKADSTGFASLIRHPKGLPSVLQSTASTFISWLLRNRHRADRRLVLSLFARAQGQYLFPGSVENPGKHVLDDRGLVKWWCKVLDPIVRSYPLEGTNDTGSSSDSTIQAKAYLIVPGQDKHETTAFFPPQARADKPDQKRWVNAHPLRQIADDPFAPPRCLVPHFPDDPKSRFLDELDEEITDVPSSQSQTNHLVSPSKRGVGQWKSVRTLEQFWDMMAFRQECSSGRLVGFIWVVFSPADIVDSTLRTRDNSPSPSPTKRKATDIERDEPVNAVKRPRRESIRRKPLSGPIQPRAPRIKTFAGSPPRRTDKRPETTEYYHCPFQTRGTLVLAQKAYDRVHEVLLRLDFADLEVASASTRKWVREAGVIAGVGERSWGVDVVGKRKRLEGGTGADAAGRVVNMLGTKKKKDALLTQDRTDVSASTMGGPTLLGNGLVRKKTKDQQVGKAPEQTVSDAGATMLTGTMVRKRTT